ncbi:DUF2628 domain-containing protein [Candidatus Bealeia paramacronuclearis]|uniref:DUF2628 domain-containing protein n=1 Tax=Candidatus Bealeia paramacronuclearis TaxID=1921001 RepID=A0ABZ2C364_9PROT|nr:hypothetical protein [Candidatus Bealeia paramacronuclearis]
METNHKKSCFEFLRIGPGETFENPESWTPSTRYYMGLLEEKEGQDLFFSWNWPGFFLFPYWAFYRNMFLFGTLAILLIGVTWPISHILGALIANPLYLHFVTHKVALGKTQKSGISWLNGILAAFGTFIIGGILFIVMLMTLYHNLSST